MSLYRREGSEYWWMNVYRGPGRSRIQRSTKKKSRVEAEVVERAFVSANAGASDRERMLKLVEMMYDADERSVELKDLGEWYRACAEDEKLKMSRRGLEARINLCGRLYEWARRETRANTVRDVTVAVAWKFSQWLGAGGAGAKSRNDYMGELGTVWKMLIKRSEAKENPWPNVRVQRDADEEQHGRAFTEAEEERIYAAAKEVGHDWYGACLVARYTGLRMKDVVNLTWGQVEDGWVYAKPSKTKRHDIKVGVPLHPKLKAWLARERARVEGLGIRVKGLSEYILPERQRHNPNNKYRGGDMSFADILKKAKVVEKDPQVKLSFHCWRHTFDTRLSEAGVAQETRMAMTGHRVKETETIYNHDVRRFVEAIGKMK